ncbi:AraC family transcriptional regulator [Paenirhodobacter sp.]|uniref:AraC family transcriptional regulator n=1 Tax=Paenirhodobacter sp. TaxID=1965326 RepID=UPI003B3C0A65
MERRSITPGFVADALACAPDPARLLARVGITPGAPVSPEHYGRLWLAIAAETGDEFFGLGARPMRPGSFALMGHAVLHAGNLERALRRAIRFLNVVLDAPAGELRVAGGTAEVALSPAGAFATRTWWLLLMGLACWLVGRRIPLLRVDFSCEAPENRADYLQFFGAPVRFGAGQSLMAFDAKHLALPVSRSERALKAFLRGAPANILLRYRHDQGLTARVRARLPGQWPGVGAVAAEMGLSPATLRRRLAAEGQSFAALRDALRRAHAERLLRETDAPIAAIATDLGYSEPGAFHRAFRGWTGQAPGAFRDQIRAACGRSHGPDTGT